MTDKTPTDLTEDHGCGFGDCDHTANDLEAMRLGRCGPLRYGGPCWLMPGHRGPHHCYREDLDALAAVLPATPPDTHAAVRALADDWPCSDETCDGQCTGCAYAADLRAALAAASPVAAEPVVCGHPSGEVLFRVCSACGQRVAAPVAADTRCTRCGLTPKAANAGVLCDPPFAGTHDFAAPVAADRVECECHLDCPIHGDLAAPVAADTETADCGATEWAACDDGRPHVYRICNRPPHADRWHREDRDGRLWAESSGDSGPIPEGPWCEHTERFHAPAVSADTTQDPT